LQSTTSSTTLEELLPAWSTSNKTPCSQPLEIQEQPADQTALSKTSTNHSDSSTYSGVSAIAVINERLRTQCATQRAASKKKKSSKSKAFKEVPRPRNWRVCQGRRQQELDRTIPSGKEKVAYRR
jgi:hypothetical protein